MIENTENKYQYNYTGEEFDCIVIGAGHAGVEASLATARLGLKTLMITISLDAIVALSCNPNIGGSGKGHLVREIDALGGEMAVNIDKTFIQSRMLNTSKGPAVHSLRVQADKKAYHNEMKKVLENTKNLKLHQGEVVDLVIEDDQVCGIITRTGAFHRAKAVVVATGTYLGGRIFIGDINFESGPDGRFPSNILSEKMTSKGFEFRRMKTGTPARVHRDTIDFSNMEVQSGDKEVVAFSFLNAGVDFGKEQVDCHLTHTTPEMHQYIVDNIHRSPMHSGQIEGVGPRYCPSIEDKIIRFKDKEYHQVFIEPEGLDTKEMYIQGVSTSLPGDMQIEMYRMIKGLENAEIMREAYAIEYDAINPTLLKRTLEHKKIKNLFFSGQINGSSGYEEAACQGLIAGINAAQNIKNKEPLILGRSESYIGVLIDDLVTKGTNEPYRMMTSRAEYRLSLRQDNADLRLTEKGYKVGLATEERYKKTMEKKQKIEEELERLKKLILTPTEKTNNFLTSKGTTPLKTSTSYYEIIRRPELTYEDLKEIDLERPENTREIRMQVETMIKYEGYITKQEQQIKQFQKMENRKLSYDMDYSIIKGLKAEAIQKLEKIKPDSIGQASRISGVTPSDINVLLIYLEQEKRKKRLLKDVD